MGKAAAEAPDLDLESMPALPGSKVAAKTEAAPLPPPPQAGNNWANKANSWAKASQKKAAAAQKPAFPDLSPDAMPALPSSAKAPAVGAASWGKGSSAAPRAAATKSVSKAA